MKKLGKLLKARRWLSISLVLLCLAVTLVLYLSPAKPPPFVVFRHPCPTPMSARDQFARLIPASPAWAWRIETGIFGRRKPVDLCADIFTLPDLSPATLSGLALPTPTFADPGGLHVWLLDAAALKTLHQRFNQTPGTDTLSRPRISTADGIQCRLFVGETIPLAGITNYVGVTMDCFPRLHHDTTDLIASITLSELVTNSPVVLAGPTPASVVSVQTNLDASFRLQIPRGSGILLLDRSPTHTPHRPIALVFSPPQPKT